MTHRILDAMIWYDTASKKYKKALYELKIQRESDNTEYNKELAYESMKVKKLKDKVRRYEEKLYRASITLYNITMVENTLKIGENPNVDG